MATPWGRPAGRAGLGAGLEATALVLGTALISLLAFEALRRLPWLGGLRPFMGLKRRLPPSRGTLVMAPRGNA